MYVPVTPAMIDAGRKAITDRYYAGGKVVQLTSVYPRELATLVLEAALNRPPAQVDRLSEEEPARASDMLDLIAPLSVSSTWEPSERRTILRAMLAYGDVVAGITNTARDEEQAGAASFQQRVQPWLLACFGEMIAGDREERSHRFLEEALELVQSCGCTDSEAHQLVDYVFGRDVGEQAQEVGGVMVTLAALCLANGLDMQASAETELARIWHKVDAIRVKQAAKPKHLPLPQQQATNVDRLAAQLAAADGLAWHEVCGIEAGRDDCDSSTCIAAHAEDHDPAACRDHYRRYARVALLSGGVA